MCTCVTCSILIGNSDNKLTQKEWSAYVKEVSWLVDMLVENIYFSGGSNGDSEYQTWCIVFELKNEENFRYHLNNIRKKYKQDSIAFVKGDTEFIC